MSVSVAYGAVSLGAGVVNEDRIIVQAVDWQNNEGDDPNDGNSSTENDPNAFLPPPNVLRGEFASRAGQALLFACHDGHDTAEAAAFVQTRLIPSLRRTKAAVDGGDSNSSIARSEDAAGLMWRRIFRSLFDTLENCFRAYANNTARTGRSVTSGVCTVCIVLEQEFLHVANVGDCRAAAIVLSRQSQDDSEGSVTFFSRNRCYTFTETDAAFTETAAEGCGSAARSTALTLQVPAEDAMSTRGGPPSTPSMLGEDGNVLDSDGDMLVLNDTDFEQARERRNDAIALMLAQQESSKFLHPTKRRKAQNGTTRTHVHWTWLTPLHRLTNELELRRVQALDAIISKPTMRLGVLQPSRTIGDYDVKAAQPRGAVLHLPTVSTRSVKTPQLLLIATDGVWDALPAVELVKKLVAHKKFWNQINRWLSDLNPLDRKPHMDLVPVARYIADECKQLDNDDTSCILALLWPSQRT